jgi:hypothetical protein
VLVGAVVAFMTLKDARHRERPEVGFVEAA